MIKSITSYRDGGTIQITMTIPDVHCETYGIWTDGGTHEICRDFRVGIKDSKCGGDMWLGYPGKEESINLSAQAKYEPLIAWIKERVKKWQKRQQQDCEKFITSIV